MRERINEQFVPVAPRHAGEMLKSIDRAQFALERHLPVIQQGGRVGEESKLVLSTSQQERVNQVLLAALAPESFLKLVTEGRATRVGMETFQEVHPELFTDLQEQAIETVLKPSTTYQAKLKLQYLFNIPVTFELSNIAEKQENIYGEAPEQAAPAAERGPLRAKGVDNLKRSESSSATSAQFG